MTGAPAYAASMPRASCPVTVDVVSSSLAMSFPSFAEDRVPSMPIAATQTTTNASPTQRAMSELAAAFASVRTHS
jgi:hypothetical protein